MVEYFLSPKGYCYKKYKNGKVKRINEKEYYKKNKKGGNVTKKYYFYFMRHGFSCANARKEDASKADGPLGIFKKRYKQIQQISVQDPNLAVEGYSNCLQLRRDIEKANSGDKLCELKDIDLIFTSPLVRAMETAFYSIPSIKPIVVAPFLCEDGWTLDNRPLSPSEQKTQRFNDIMPPVQNKTITQRVEPVHEYSNDDTKSDIKLFLQYIWDKLPSPSTTPMKILVVSHHKTLYNGLKKHTNWGDYKNTKICNNSIHRLGLNDKDDEEPSFDQIFPGFGKPTKMLDMNKECFCTFGHCGNTKEQNISKGEKCGAVPSGNITLSCKQDENSGFGHKISKKNMALYRGNNPNEDPTSEYNKQLYKNYSNPVKWANRYNNNKK